MSSPPQAIDHVSRLMLILKAHWVFTLATRPPAGGPSAPHCAPLFYAIDPGSNETAPVLVFTSDPDSTHGLHIGQGPTQVGGALYLESETVGELRGVQLRASAVRLDNNADREASARAIYLARHPVAAAMLAKGRHRLFALTIEWAKLTDNRLGFGQHPIVTFTEHPSAS